MLIKIIRFLRGYIVFTVVGSYPERMINLFNRSGVNYWDLLPEEDCYSGKMLLSDYRNIRKIARKASVRLSSKKRVGLPFIIKKYKMRKGIAFGGVLAVLLMIFLSGFVWDVKLNGVQRLEKNEIYNALSESGLKVGAFKGAVDFEAVERELVLKVPEIRWVSINALNSIAEVEIKEKFLKPVVKKGKYPCNLVAKCDGIITDTLISRGTCKVKRGSAVAENQVLVSTVVEGTNEMLDKLTYVHSDGKIYADVLEKRSFNQPLDRNYLIPEKNYIDKTELCFLWFKLPLKINSSDNELSSGIFYAERLKLNGITLPLGINRLRIYGFNKTIKKVNKEKIKILLKKKAMLSEAFNFGNFKIKNKKYSFTELKDTIHLNAEYIINKNIAVKKRVKVE